jgi:fatty acid desaturase
VFFYFTYLGGFWLAVPLTSLVFVFAPSLLHGWLARRNPSVGAMLLGIPQRQFRRIRVEALGVFALHGVLIWALGLHWSTWVLLYGMFAVCWSSQNYLGHAGSPLDVQEGAHNLRANPVFEKWLLHFNWHLAHHQHPDVPWLYLPQFDDSRRERPGYLRSFVKFWAGPRPAPKGKEAS